MHFEKIYVEISITFVQIVMPNLDPEHEISAISSNRVESEQGWIISVGSAAGGYDAHHVEGVEYFVGEDCHECHHEKYGHASS